MKAYDPQADEDLLNRAYVFAMRAHGGQTRKSGDPYFTHPLAVAGILTELKADPASVATALLHDVVEDTDTSVDDIVGVVFRRDVLASEEPDRPVRHLVRPAEFIAHNEPVDRTLELMLERKRHMLVVVDEFGGFAGVVSLEDVLEEILGEEIVDEFDEVVDLRELALERRAAALDRTR